MKHLAKISIFILVAAVLLVFSGMPILTVASNSTEKAKEVKVAFFPMEGYNDVVDGTYGGMDVEYLDSVCIYTGWKINYVPCSSWDEALFLLKNKQVDLVGSAQYSKEREEQYAFADLPSGYTFGAVVVNNDSKIAYEDFEVLKNAKFGVVKTYVRKNDFIDYMKQNGVKKPKILEYESTETLNQALNNKEVDAMVLSFTERREGQRIVGKFAPKPYYYITYKGNEELVRELDHAIIDLKINQPELEDALMEKYYQGKMDQTIVYTTEEKKYVEEKKKLKLGYIKYCYPLSYEENGEFKGIWQQSLEKMSKTIGLEFEYVGYDNENSALKALISKEIDVIAYCTMENEELQNEGVRATNSFASIPTVIVSKSSNADLSTRIGVAGSLYNEAKEAIGIDDENLVEYNSQKDCLDAIVNDKVKSAFLDGYLAEYYLSLDNAYSKLEIAKVLNIDHDVSMAFMDSEDDCLKDILDKSMPIVTDKQISEYMLKENVHASFSFEKFIREYSELIIGFLVVLIFTALIIGIHMYRDSKKIQSLLYKDVTMDVWNLNYLILKSKELFSSRSKEKYAVVAINVAQFKLFNALYGWEAGQNLLKKVVTVFEEKVNFSKEVFSRSQGDHFILLLNYTDENDFYDRLEDIKNRIKEVIFEMTDNHMTITMGVYLLPTEGRDIEKGILYANQAMEALHDIKNQEILEYDEEFDKNIKEEHSREKLLSSVDFEKDFVVYYQAKVDIRTEKIIGAEALVRFLDPTDKKIKAPYFFIPYFEKTGRITEIDFFVLESVCKMLRRRIDAGLNVVTISCNFSRHHFMRPGFTEKFERIINRYNIPKELIEVEITETLVVEELQQQAIKKTIEELREKEIRISIDDFGSGYSSLGVFEQIPASVIKLDRSFLLNQEDRNRQVAIMKGIVHMAGDLDAQVVCEGVETEEDVELMHEIGAYVAQGYRYSKPIPEAEFAARLD